MNHPSNMSALSSDSSGYHLSQASSNAWHSTQSRDFSTMELNLANHGPQIDQGLELSPAEGVHDLNQPQRSASTGEKTELGINHGFFTNSGSNGISPVAKLSKRKRKVVAAVILIILAIALPVGLTRHRKKSR